MKVDEEVVPRCILMVGGSLLENILLVDWWMLAIAVGILHVAIFGFVPVFHPLHVAAPREVLLLELIGDGFNCWRIHATGADNLPVSVWDVGQLTMLCDFRGNLSRRN